MREGRETAALRKGERGRAKKICGTAENSIRNLVIAANGVQAFAGRCSPRKEVTVCTLYALIDLAGAIQIDFSRF
jgi:hypothetical protein